jgi:predicted nucleic acid-binding Zn ribbon protein
MKFAPMERAGRSLAKLKLSGKISVDGIALAAWPAAVGERIASHARAVALVRGNLVVEVEDAIWKKQLFYLRSQIVAKVQGLLGDNSVTDVEFRLATPRRPPQVAQALTSQDEADGIPDRMLRIVYRQARKKAAG